MKTIAEHILDAYQVRPCWLCCAVGPCAHREPKVEGAYVEAYWLRRKQPPLSLIHGKKKAATP